MTRIVAALETDGTGHTGGRPGGPPGGPGDRHRSGTGASWPRSRSLKNAFLAEQLHRLTAEERQGLGELTGLLERLVAQDEP